jgi:hypothetical protein
MARRSMADSEIPVNWRGQAVLSLQNEGGLRRDKTRKSIECPILSSGQLLPFSAMGRSIPAFEIKAV